MAWYEDLYIIFEANNDILQYWYIDIILSLYTLYNDSIIYNYGILYILQTAFSVCFMFWMLLSAGLCTWLCPKQLPIAFFLSPLLLSLLLALIKVACVAVLFFQRCVPQCRQGHSFLQCVLCWKCGYGFAFAFSLDGTDFMNHFHRA